MISVLFLAGKVLRSYTVMVTSAIEKRNGLRSVDFSLKHIVDLTEFGVGFSIV